MLEININKIEYFLKIKFTNIIINSEKLKILINLENSNGNDLINITEI